MKKFIIACSIAVLIIAALWIQDVISDRRNDLSIMTSITLLEKAPQNYTRENRNIGVVQSGEKVKVLRMGYGKDFRAWKIRGSSGQEGWFVEEKGNVIVN